MANWLYTHVILLFVNTKLTLDWVHKQFVTTVHLLFFILHDIMDPYMMIKYDRHTSTRCLGSTIFVLLMASQCNRATWPLWRKRVKSDITLVIYRFYSRRYSQPVVEEIIRFLCYIYIDVWSLSTVFIHYAQLLITYIFMVNIIYLTTAPSIIDIHTYQNEYHFLQLHHLGACLNIQLPSYQYGNYHCKDTTGSRPSYL